MSKSKQVQADFKINNSRVLIITGTPGVGKSSVSRNLLRRTNSELISPGELVRKEKLYAGKDRKRDTLVANIERLSELVRQMITKSYVNILIEGHYAVSLVPPSWVRRVFVLRRNPEELEKVLRERRYKENKVSENLAAEILDVCLYDAVERCGVEKVCEVDVTGRKASDVAEEIVAILNGGKKCRVRIVDWLGKLDSEGKLDLYLKDF